MTRILHLITSADPREGGPIATASALCKLWSAGGHSHDLVTLDPADHPPPTNFPGRVFSLGEAHGRTPLRRYRYAPRLTPWLRANAPRYDAVLVSGLWRYHARGAMTALAGGPTPYFVFTHGMLDPWFRRTYPIKHLGKQVSWWLAEGPLLERATNVLFTTAEEEALAEDAFWPYRVRGQVVHYGTADLGGEPAAQIAAFRAAVPSLGGRRFLLFLSRIHLKKGCDLLVEAFGTVAAEQPDLDLVIAGPDQSGLVAGLKEQAQRLGIAGRVHFPGMLQGEVKAGAFRAAEAFALTSHQENFGIVVAEALAAGTPVLISDKVNIWREVAADGAGLVQPDTVEGARTLLSRFLGLTASEHAAMRARARASFVRRFDVDQAAAALMRLIQAHVSSSDP